MSIHSDPHVVQMDLLDKINCVTVVDDDFNLI